MSHGSRIDPTLQQRTAASITGDSPARVYAATLSIIVVVIVQQLLSIQHGDLAGECRPPFGCFRNHVTRSRPPHLHGSVTTRLAFRRHVAPASRQPSVTHGRTRLMSPERLTPGSPSLLLLHLRPA